MIRLYIRTGKVIVPTVVKTQAGYYLELEPVSVLEHGDEEGLARVLLDRLSQDTRVIATPTRETLPNPPVVLPHAGVKSWAAFAKKATVWSVSREAKHFEVEGPLGPEDPPQAPPEKVRLYPRDKRVEELAKELAAMASRS